jgi:hypothetical protein
VAYGVREVHEPIVDDPLSDVVAQLATEGEVGRLARLQRRHDVVRKLVLWELDEFDLLAGILLEDGDDFPKGRVLLGVVTLVPPHHKVGGLCAERRHREHHGKNRGSAAHVVTSPIGRTASISSLPVPGNSRQPRSERVRRLREGQLGVTIGRTVRPAAESRAGRRP